MLNSINLRDVKADDLDFLIELRVKTMEEHLLRAGSRVDHKAMLDRILYKLDHAKIVTFDNEDIGLFKVDKTKDIWDLVQIQIHPDFQNKGLGSYLLNSLLLEASQEEKEVGLEALKGNPVNRLYESLGFETIYEDEQKIKMLYRGNDYE